MNEINDLFYKRLVFTVEYRRQGTSNQWQAIALGDFSYHEWDEWHDGEVRIEQVDDVIVIRIHSLSFMGATDVDHAQESANELLHERFPGHTFLYPPSADPK